MRELVVTQNVTLDGVVDLSSGWFMPQGAGEQDGSTDDIGEEIAAQDARSDALLVGRRTFEDFRGYWPHRDDDTTGISAYLDGVDKYVVSGTLTEPGWENTTVISGDLAAGIAALKDRPGLDIVATGSIRLVHELAARGLVDEYRLFVYPVVVGSGRRLFAPDAPAPELRLAGTRTFRSGVVLLTYRVLRPA
ncbi:dihydrofolate reductase family protein [Cellulomonas sp. JH27-2]|uniref:dihydrofolate reductase family protein n=1 Tax=Cellulomonas sp. JH27-2 TaxID=2774139 RepID=UPI001780079C|nr:dihydrofolate reductase family protein [Cellulomonas sp. JH27-2]